MSLLSAIDQAWMSEFRVMEMAWGTAYDYQGVRDAIGRAAYWGVVMIAASGNNPACVFGVTYPAKYTEVIAVTGLSDTNPNALAPIACGGAEVDVAVTSVNRTASTTCQQTTLEVTDSFGVLRAALPVKVASAPSCGNRVCGLSPANACGSRIDCGTCDPGAEKCTAQGFCLPL